MATTEPSYRNRVAGYLIAIASFAAGALVVQYLRSSPQIGPSEEVFKTVDALFTAVSSKDTQRLDDCEQRLNQYRDDGELTSSAAARLDKIIKQARAGDWDNSAKHLYDFMLSQRGG